MKNILSICPYCGTGCALYLKVVNGKVRGVMPSVASSANRGLDMVAGKAH